MIASQRQLEAKYNQAKDTSDQWYRRAQLALEKGDEGLAREALSRRKGYDVSPIADFADLTSIFFLASLSAERSHACCQCHNMACLHTISKAESLRLVDLSAASLLLHVVS